MKNLIYILLLPLLLFGCGGGLPEIGGNFKSQEWKDDALACSSQRALMLESILEAKDNLVQLGEPEIRRVFGKPDHIELFSRSQKFYLYYIEAGGQCAGQGGQSNGRMLEISLDALARLHEINIRQ